MGRGLMHTTFRRGSDEGVTGHGRFGAKKRAASPGWDVFAKTPAQMRRENKRIAERGRGETPKAATGGETPTDQAQRAPGEHPWTPPRSSTSKP